MCTNISLYLLEPTNIGFTQFGYLTVNQRVAGSSPAEGAKRNLTAIML